uniref:Uncharacterized protein n=1 Tax=Oryctolagus cuniculus TaxID=9986 RepID=A0A5F9DN23_RABIT
MTSPFGGPQNLEGIPNLKKNPARVPRKADHGVLVPGWRRLQSRCTPGAGAPQALLTGTRRPQTGTPIPANGRTSMPSPQISRHPHSKSPQSQGDP